MVKVSGFFQKKENPESKIMFWIFSYFLFSLLLSCQPTNTMIRAKSNGSNDSGSGNGSGSGNQNNSDMQQLRITGSDDLVLPGTETTIALGDSLALKAAVTNLSNQVVAAASVRWAVKTLSGSLASGLSCGSSETSTCSFTPTTPGTFYIEILLLQRDGSTINFSDVTHPIIVTAPLVPSNISVVSGNNQTAIVNSNLTNTIEVLVTDVFLRPVPGASVSVAATAGGGSVVSANPQSTDANGKVRVQLKVGTTSGVSNNTFTAEVVGSSPLLSVPLQASAFPGAADHLVFTTMPSGSYAVLPLSTQPVLELKDAFNNTLSSVEAVTVTVANGAGTLSGNTTRNLNGGSVFFTDLAYSDAGSGVTLRFRTATGVETISDPLSLVLPNGVGSITPNDVSFEKTIATNPGAAGRSSSNIVTVAGIASPIGVSVSGPGNPQLRINGQAAVTSATNVQANDTIQLLADAPSVSGSTNVITLVMGGRTETWDMRYVDSQRVAYVFVSSTAYYGVAPGSNCQSVATSAGYGGTWSPIISSGSANIKDLVPWDWGQLRRLDGQLVATSWSDLWDGSLINPINVTETLGISNTAVWTGIGNTLAGTADANTCGNWSAGWSGPDGRPGDSSSTTLSWLSGSFAVNCDQYLRIYCISNPSSMTDDTPTSFSFSDLVKYTGTVRETSNSIRVSGINKTVTASVSSSAGNASMKVNGGSEVTTATLFNGDSVVLVMDSPSVVGTTNTATLTVGSFSADWKLSYADSSNEAIVFVTSTGRSASYFGSLSATDSNCQTLASSKGYGGTWTAMITNTSTPSLQKRIPWNWGKLKLLNGTIVANSWSDLWDGTIQNPINVNENGLITLGNVWTGVVDTAGKSATSASTQSCENWTDGTGSRSGTYGGSSLITGGWILAGTQACNTSYYNYCISDPSGANDTTPNPVSFLKEVSYTSGQRTTSNAVILSGISKQISVSVSGASGNPRLKINGGSEIISGTASWGDSIEVVMDAPTTFNTTYTASVVLGSSGFTWSLGYADSSKVARLFVTSESYNGNLGGLAGADAKCNLEAQAAGFTSGSWKALLSDSATDARERVPFNWGTLKRIDGSTIIATSWSDLWDGSIQNPVLLSATQNSLLTTSTLTYSTTEGLRAGTVAANTNCQNWLFNGTSVAPFNVGASGSTASSWISNNGSSPSSCGATTTSLYCIEDNPAGTDLTPTSFEIPYKIFQATSTRIESAPIVVGGLSPSVSVSVVLIGSQGNPAFKLNGGAEQTSGTLQNGDSLTLIMDTPASYNQSHKVEVKVGDGAPVPWRLWTGNASSGIKKRVFITSTSNLRGNLGGVGGADIICQNAAANNSNLNGYTWKAIVSGDSAQETAWAINRVGYDWAELWSFNADGSFKDRIFSGANFWNGTAPEASFNLNEMAVTITTNIYMFTNTRSDGRSFATGTNSCLGFTSSGGYPRVGLINDPNWVNTTSGDCVIGLYRLYCIQQ